MKKLLKWLLLLMPACLFLSYHPVIKLGESETMYFELSVAEIWLIVFDMVAFVKLCREGRLFSGFRGKWWMWALFPVWVSLTIVWSLNVTRGLLTAGLMWALVFACYAIWSLRGMLDRKFREKWWKWFFGATLVVCVWCVVQCVLDLAGAPQTCSLLCDGCTYRMFGFPHPNGFAIEPQFMGNLLLAPIMASAYLWLSKKQISNKLLICFFIIVSTLFLTFSRGAIYAFIVGMLFMSGFVVAREKKKKRGTMWKRVGVVWSLVVGAFAVALVMQGVMAEVSPTSDSFGDGLAKVVNHLSLGVINVKGDSDGGKTVENSVEESVENSVEKIPEDEKGYAGEKLAREVEGITYEKTEAVFDGYVAESTDTRVRLAGAAVKVWSGDLETAVFGVGLGGAGQALYNNGLSPAPREIVQNEYASILLETGFIGVVLFALAVILIVRFVFQRKDSVGMVLSLLVTYGVTLVFFSGIPNVLHMFLLPIMFLVVCSRRVKILVE